MEVALQLAVSNRLPSRTGSSPRPGTGVYRDAPGGPRPSCGMV